MRPTEAPKSYNLLLAAYGIANNVSKFPEIPKIALIAHQTAFRASAVCSLKWQKDSITCGIRSLEKFYSLQNNF